MSQSHRARAARIAWQPHATQVHSGCDTRRERISPQQQEESSSESSMIRTRSGGAFGHASRAAERLVEQQPVHAEVLDRLEELAEIDRLADVAVRAVA